MNLLLFLSSFSVFCLKIQLVAAQIYRHSLRNRHALWSKSVTLLYVKPAYISFQSGQRDTRGISTNTTVMVVQSEQHCFVVGGNRKVTGLITATVKCTSTHHHVFCHSVLILSNYWSVSNKWLIKRSEFKQNTFVKRSMVKSAAVKSSENYMKVLNDLN